MYSRCTISRVEVNTKTQILYAYYSKIITKVHKRWKPMHKKEVPQGFLNLYFSEYFEAVKLFPSPIR